MLFNRRITGKKTDREDSAGIHYDNSSLQVIFFACVIIVVSVFFMGRISYSIAEQAVIEKLKTRDLPYIVGSMADKIDGRIQRAKETAVVLANDPFIIRWLKGREQDEQGKRLVLAKLDHLAAQYDYSNSFVVSALTGNYWAEGGRLLGVMSRDNPADAWFFSALSSKNPVAINIDYNRGRNRTFVFINALMGDIDNPLAVAGVGLDLDDIAGEFAVYKQIADSKLWLVDRNGKIHLSAHTGDNGKDLADFVPAAVKDNIIARLNEVNNATNVSEYLNPQGEVIDLVFKPMKATDWKLVFQVPRKESLAALSSIKTNTLIAGAVALIFIVLIFYLISYRIADPFKRAVRLSQELEKKVEARTRELADKNEKILDSLDYAKRIQESILPDIRELSGYFPDFFLIWKPRDIVGGDFYWFKKLEDGVIIAVGDCTGHGVPGALMTTVVNSLLPHVVEEVGRDDPALILQELNRRVKKTLHKDSARHPADDGLDIAVCRLRSGRDVTYAGARMPLYVKCGDRLDILPGDKMSLGYKKSDTSYVYSNAVIPLQAGLTFYLTTDGFIDQNGGTQDYSFGKKRWLSLINQVYTRPLTEQRQLFEQALADYMQGEPQRDDITVIAFTID